MPSKLTGLFKTLAWSDFQGSPDPKKPNLDAFTSPSFSFSQQPTFTHVAGTKPPLFELSDNVVLDIQMDSQKSWQRSAQIKSKGAAYEANLLKHEQGHYDMVALIARDLFIDVMQLKGQQFKTLSDALSALRAVFSRFDKKTQKISDIYDSKAETDHGAIASSQKKWNDMIQRSFTEARSPAVTAPDGKTYKIPFLDVLSQNAINP
ncbi:MAG: hypothetical protein HY235_29900 [Acidobacteria bacterium]|nr:hypothetical protein [Acidobacteriota bacterium]